MHTCLISTVCCIFYSMVFCQFCLQMDGGMSAISIRRCRQLIHKRVDRSICCRLSTGSRWVFQLNNSGNKNHSALIIYTSDFNEIIWIFNDILTYRRNVKHSINFKWSLTITKGGILFFFLWNFFFW